MGLKYTRSELAQLTGLSVETIKKRAIKMGLKETSKTINNREIIAYELSDEDLKDLNQALGIETPLETFKTNIETPNDTTKTPVNPESVIDKFIEYTKYNEERLEKYIERALKAEQQQKLIETSEVNKDAEINRLNALVKQLQAENEQLKKKSWKFWK